MNAEGTFVNFAYGSNMCTRRLRTRVPSARVLGLGHLTHHALRWHKRSHDGSGKCDAWETGLENDVIWGVLWEIDRSEKHRLDEAEGLHHGYEEKTVTIVAERGLVPAQIYYATVIDRSRRPYQWYKEFVLAGAGEHGLPASYILGLESMESIPDSDTDRATLNERILFDG